MSHVIGRLGCLYLIVVWSLCNVSYNFSILKTSLIILCVPITKVGVYTPDYSPSQDEGVFLLIYKFSFLSLCL